MPEFVCFWQKEYYNKNRLLHFEKMSEKPERRFDMKTKKKRIAQEIQSRILTIVIAIFMVVAVVVAVMVGNVSLSAQKNDLEMQSKAASYQLEIFFQLVI